MDSTTVQQIRQFEFRSLVLQLYELNTNVSRNITHAQFFDENGTELLSQNYFNVDFSENKTLIKLNRELICHSKQLIVFSGAHSNSFTLGAKRVEEIVLNENFSLSNVQLNGIVIYDTCEPTYVLNNLRTIEDLVEDGFNYYPIVIGVAAGLGGIALIAVIVVIWKRSR